MLCISVEVAVVYQPTILKLTQNYDLYDFPMPVQCTLGKLFILKILVILVTLHTDTWVYKNSKHEFCVFASKHAL